jgi:hypothetical protein
MRQEDTHGDTIPRVGDIVVLRADVDEAAHDPGTVIKILDLHAHDAQAVAVKWFAWDGGRTTEEYVNELHIISKV